MAETRPALEEAFNPFDPEFCANARPVHERLREEAPLFWSPASNAWVLSRYDDVRNVVLNWKVFSNAAGDGSVGEKGKFFHEYPILIMFDPPRHTELRRILAGHFAPAAMRELRDWTRAEIIRQFDALAGRHRIDLIADFAEMFPNQVIGRMMGLPPEDLRFLADCADAITDVLHPDFHANITRAFAEMSDYFDRFLTDRASRPAGPDISWRLVMAERDDEITRKEAIGFANILGLAGGETTTKMIGHAALALFHHPEQRAELVKSPELIPNAMEEALRYNSSTHTLNRTLKTDVELHGKTLAKGETVAILLNSANNDPRKFANPDAFNIHRRLRGGDHLAFGAGVHACLGAPLARMELVLIFEEMLKRWPNYRIDESAIVRRDGPVTQGYKALPFEFGV